MRNSIWKKMKRGVQESQSQNLSVLIDKFKMRGKNNNSQAAEVDYEIQFTKFETNQSKINYNG